MLVAVTALAIAGGAFAAAPNGETSRTPDQIAADAKVAALAAKTVHVVGTIKSGKDTISLDLRLVAASGGSGSMRINGLLFHIIRIGPTAYFSATAATWKHFGGSFASAVFSNKWLKTSATKGQFAAFTSLTDMRALFRAIFPAAGTLLAPAQTTIGGKPSVELTDPAGKGAMYVATTGAPYPLQLAQGGSGEIDFKDWNGAVRLAAPKSSIDATKLFGG